MEANDIFAILKERNKGPGFAVLNVLNRAETPLNRSDLRKQTDEILQRNAQAPALQSRHGIEKYIAKLDGAGLINIHSVGTAHLYSISDLGKALLNYSRQLKQN